MSPVTKDTLPFPPSPADVDVPAGTDRRSFLMRSAVIGAAAVMTGCDMSTQERAKRPASEAPTPPKPGPALGSVLSSDLDIVARSKGPSQAGEQFTRMDLYSTFV